MPYRITITHEAESQLRSLAVREQRILESAVLTRLTDRPTTIAKAIKRNSMDMKVIPLSRLEADPKGTRRECADTGQAFVIELPDHRLVSIQTLETAGDDQLVDDLLESNPSFRALVEKSKASPRRPFSS